MNKKESENTKLLYIIEDDLNSINEKLSRIIELISKKCECKHSKDEEEVLSIFSDIIDDLDHVTIKINKNEL